MNSDDKQGGDVISVDLSAGGWSAIPDQAFRSSSLSLAARGLLAFFLVLPKGFEIRVNWCMSQNNLTRWMWSKLTNELADGGYYHRRKRRDKFGQIRTHVTVSPTPREPVSVLPASVQPNIGSAEHRSGQRANLERCKLNIEIRKRA